MDNMWWNAMVSWLSREDELEVDLEVVDIIVENYCGEVL